MQNKLEIFYARLYALAVRDRVIVVVGFLILCCCYVTIVMFLRLFLLLHLLLVLRFLFFFFHSFKLFICWIFILSYFLFFQSWNAHKATTSSSSSTRSTTIVNIFLCAFFHHVLVLFFACTVKEKKIKNLSIAGWDFQSYYANVYLQKCSAGNCTIRLRFRNVFRSS